MLNDIEADLRPDGAADEDLEKAKTILLDMLRQHEGCASTRLLRKDLEAKGVRNVGEIIARLKFYEPEEAKIGEARFHHHGRSFYSEEAFRQIEEKTRVAAEGAEAEEAPLAVPDSQEPTPTREYRQEEARIVTYVKEELDDLYGTEFGPECKYVFDVHNSRAGSGYENIDLIAVHWRSDDIVELVTVEVKLAFHAKLVHQAANYTRFSDRVWIAVPVEAPLVAAATELRDLDPLLFEYVVEIGLGILACRRGRGRSYEVAPVHWPRLLRPERLERAAFLDRHRAIFEEACAIPPQKHQQYPKLHL